MILRANWIELVTGELVGVRVVAGDEIDPSVHEHSTLRESRSNGQLGALELRQRLRQLRAGGMPAAVDFGRTRQLVATSRRRGSRARRDQAYSGASSIIEMEQ